VAVSSLANMVSIFIASFTDAISQELVKTLAQFYNDKQFFVVCFQTHLKEVPFVEAAMVRTFDNVKSLASTRISTSRPTKVNTNTNTTKNKKMDDASQVSTGLSKSKNGSLKIGSNSTEKDFQQVNKYFFQLRTNRILFNSHFFNNSLD